MWYNVMMDENHASLINAILIAAAVKWDKVNEPVYIPRKSIMMENNGYGVRIQETENGYLMMVESVAVHEAEEFTRKPYDDGR